MGIDVHFGSTYISFSLSELAAWAASAVVLVGAVLAASEMLYRRLRSARSDQDTLQADRHLRYSPPLEGPKRE